MLKRNEISNTWTDRSQVVPRCTNGQNEISKKNHLNPNTLEYNPLPLELSCESYDDRSSRMAVIARREGRQNKKTLKPKN